MNVTSKLPPEKEEHKHKSDVKLPVSSRTKSVALSTRMPSVRMLM